jgi:hypothetical protein
MTEQHNPWLANELKKQHRLAEFSESLGVLHQLRISATEHHQERHAMAEDEIAHELFDGKYGRPTLEDYEYVLRRDSDAYRGELAARVAQLFLVCLAADDLLFAPCAHPT